jgi:hypothetical protein
MERYIRLLAASEDLKKLAAGAAGKALSSLVQAQRFLAEKGAPAMGEALKHSIYAAPVVGAGYVGVKGYKKGREKVREIKRRRMIRKMQRMQRGY